MEVSFVLITKRQERKNMYCYLRIHTREKVGHIERIQISFDEGKTWPKSHHLLLDEVTRRRLCKSDTSR
jgi:hypothetical protein